MGPLSKVELALGGSVDAPNIVLGSSSCEELVNIPVGTIGSPVVRIGGVIVPTSTIVILELANSCPSLGLDVAVIGSSGDTNVVSTFSSTCVVVLVGRDDTLAMLKVDVKFSISLVEAGVELVPSRPSTTEPIVVENLIDGSMSPDVTVKISSGSSEAGDCVL